MTIYKVSNVTELYSAMKLAVGGDRIELAAGHYNYIELKDKYTKTGLAGELNFDSPVTITSADPENPPTIGSVNIAYSNNISFDNVVFNTVNDSTGGYHANALNVNVATNISFTNSKFVGTAEKHPEVASDLGNDGASFRFNTGITFSGNEVSNFNFAIAFQNNTDVTFTDNHLHTNQGDFLRFPGTVNGVISGNTFENHLSSPFTHADYIQFWTNNQTRGAENITISGNNFLNGDYYAQAIFMRNELNDLNGGAYPEHNYKEITIEDNVILNAHGNTIVVGYVDGLIVKNNTLIDDDTFAEGERDTMSPNISVSHGTSVEIYNNIVPGQITLKGGTVADRLEDNFFTNDAFSEFSNYTGKLFLNSFNDKDISLEDLLVNPDSILVKEDGTVYGSQRLAINTYPDDLTALIVREPMPTEGPTVIKFDASLTANSNGLVDAQDARFVWDFGDGHTAEGLVVQHMYADHGNYNATLTVIHKDGTTDTTKTLAIVKDPLLLDLDFSTDGVSDASSYASNLTVKNPDGVQLQSDGSYAYNPGVREIVDVSRGSSQLFNHDQITLDVVVSKNTATSGGQVLSIGKSFMITVLGNGEVVFNLTNDQNQNFSLGSQGAGITDTDKHRITVTYDKHTETTTMYVDGQVVGETSMTGNTKATQSWGFYVGNPWGASFDGLVHDVKMYSDALTHDEILNGYSLGGDAETEVVVPGASEEVVEEVVEDTDNDQSDDVVDTETETETETVTDSVGEPVVNEQVPQILTLDDIAAMSSMSVEPTLTAHGIEGERFYGRHADDVIMGTDSDDEIWAKNGEDVVFGGAGNDFINAFGHGIGKNFMSGGDGNDVLSGADDRDILIGDAGDDRLLGRDGDDILIGGDGDDYLQGGNGNDILYGGAGSNRYQGGPGDDIFVLSHYESGVDTIYSGFELGKDKFDISHLLDEANLELSSDPADVLDIFSLELTNKYANVYTLIMNVNDQAHDVINFKHETPLTMESLIDSGSVMSETVTIDISDYFTGM